MQQHRFRVAGFGEDLAHGVGGGLFAGHRRPVGVAAPFPFPLREVFGVQVVQDGHDGGVGQRPGRDQPFHHPADRQGRLGGPQHVHHGGFQ